MSFLLVHLARQQKRGETQMETQALASARPTPACYRALSGKQKDGRPLVPSLVLVLHPSLFFLPVLKINIEKTRKKYRIACVT